MGVYNNDLIVGGDFSNAGNKVSAYLARWTKKDEADVKEIADTEALPCNYYLKQNHPNPFNPATIIEYNVPVKSHVKIDIFNILGMKIQTLVNETQTTGEYQIFWDGKDYKDNDVATGIYFYRLQAGNFIDTKKMILLK